MYSNKKFNNDPFLFNNNSSKIILNNNFDDQILSKNEN